MALISIPNTFTVGAVIVASQHNANFSIIYSDYNGNIDNTNITAAAAIVDTKLAQIATAGKVSGAAFISLTSIPSGAGLIPIANIDIGTTASKIVSLDGSAKLPAVDGSALTNLTATLSSIKDYGTSASASTAKTQANLKIAYGSITVSGSSSQAITNLSFTNSTSYVVQVTGTTGNFNENFSVANDSGFQTTISNNHNDSRTAYWLAIGT